MQAGYLDNLNTLLSYFKHLLSLVFPLTTLLFLTTGLFIENEAHSIVSIFVFTIPFWLVLLLDWRCPKEKRQASSQHPTLFFDGILAVLTVIQLVNVLLMLNYIGLLRWDNTQDSIVSLANLVAIRFLVGTSSGTSGIVVAHELIHRREWIWQWAGRLLLCTVCYEHFVITHKRGHHLNLGMPDDIATAQLGESFKDYWRRIYIGYLKYAWRSEQERLSNSSNINRLIQNQVLQGIVAETAILIFILVYWGWLAAAMFIYQALVAVRILEAVNYFQHWGLEDGQFGNTYGWVCPSWISRYALIGLSHHIGHHQDENNQYYEVDFSDQGPVLPYGYFVMNLWVKLGNGSYQMMAVRELEKYRRSVG
ncbi:MAG: fatty acid desaturase [Methylococcaceae bacterium]|nr:fatty acid desaturase [Methylococcaceae bacterium]